MVSLSTVRSSNSQIASTYPSGLVAVFVGATSGIGCYTLKSFATATRATTNSRIYFIGRSQSAGERITSELQTINPTSTFTFIQFDISLLKNVDEVCKTIKSKEKVVNLLVLSAGVLIRNQTTDEGLDLMLATAYYSRNRFIANLLPLLQKAYETPVDSPGMQYGAVLSRVVTVFAGGYEGKFYENDIPAKTVPFIHARGHLSSLTTLALTHFARQAPGVSFIHSYPGPVKSGLDRGATGFGMLIFRGIFKVIGPLINIDPEECGDRHVFEVTSSLYSSLGSSKVVFEGDEEDNTKTHGKVTKNGWERPIDGVGDKAEKDVEVTRSKGVDGFPGTGVYCVLADCEPAGEKVVKLLDGLKNSGMVEKVWEHTGGEFRRITGSDSI